MTVWDWLAKPLNWIINLKREQLRSLFGVAMLGGLMANSLLSAGAVWAAVSFKLSGPLLDAVLTHVWTVDLLSFWFALILGAVVFGADYFKAKYAGGEFELGGKNNAGGGDA